MGRIKSKLKRTRTCWKRTKTEVDKLVHIWSRSMETWSRVYAKSKEGRRKTDRISLPATKRSTYRMNRCQDLWAWWTYEQYSCVTPVCSTCCDISVRNFEFLAHSENRKEQKHFQELAYSNSKWTLYSRREPDSNILTNHFGSKSNFEELKSIRAHCKPMFWLKWFVNWYVIHMPLLYTKILMVRSQGI